MAAKPEPRKEFTCYCCDDSYDGEENGVSNVVLYDGDFKRDGEACVLIQDTAKWRHVCDGCFEDNDNVLYCAISGVEFLCSEFSYTYVDEPFDNYVLGACLVVMGYQYDPDYDDGTRYFRPEETMSDTYVDFYWYLDKGKRHGMLQVEDGGEKQMTEALEQKIFERVKAAGGDVGDPKVVNVYTRLQLIEEGLLPKDYTL